jgi:hypothetical protein
MSITNNAYRDAKQERKIMDITKGTSDFEGWGTALKPAFEPITIARKPLSENTVAENVLKWGTGGLNIDGSRVETEDRIPITAGVKKVQSVKESTEIVQHKKPSKQTVKRKAASPPTSSTMVQTKF